MVPQNQVPPGVNHRWTSKRKPMAWWRERTRKSEQRSGEGNEKTGTKNSVRDAKVVADGEDVKTTRE
jgi:hypothetical protein